MSMYCFYVHCSDIWPPGRSWVHSEHLPWEAGKVLFNRPVPGLCIASIQARGPCIRSASTPVTKIYILLLVAGQQHFARCFLCEIFSHAETH